MDAGKVLIFGSRMRPRSLSLRYTVDSETLNPSLSVISEGQVGACGRCDAKARVNFRQTHMQIFTWPGKSVDEYEDFDDWTLSEIRERVELVQGFDKLCDDIVSAFIDTCRNYRITEEEILVLKTIKVLEPVG